MTDIPSPQPAHDNGWLHSGSNHPARPFAEWLNDQRMKDVSQVFHEIMARYCAAIAVRPSAASPTVDEQRELLKRLRYYGDSDRDAACTLIEQLGAALHAAEGRADMASRAYASSQNCISEWVGFGSKVADALGLLVMSPKAIFDEIARLRAAVDAEPLSRFGFEAVINPNIPAGVIRLYKDGKLVGEVKNIKAP